MDFRHLAILLGAMAMLSTWPTSIAKMRVINSRKFLSIQTSKIDPPRLAFDEIHSEENKLFNEWDALRSKPGSQISVGEEALQFAAKSPVQTLQNRKVVLRSMTFTRQEVEEKQRDVAWVEDLPPTEQKRVLEAQNKFGTLDEDWTPPSFQELAAEKISEIKKQLSSSTEPSKTIVQSVQTDGSIQTPEAVHTADVQVRSTQWTALSGMIEIKGLPSGHPQWQIRVARYEDDVKKEDGRVDVSASTFRITVPQMTGTLRAEMVDANTGETLGIGDLRLSEYALSQKQGKSKITIQAIDSQMSVAYHSFYDNPSLNGRSGKTVATRVLLASVGSEGKTDRSGVYTFDRMQRGSWALMRTEAKGFRSGMYMVQSGSEQKLPLFPESMIQAMTQIIRDQSVKSEVAETGSIVWGQVLNNGRPVAGAEILVEGFENYQPVYFNALLIPDPQMKSTSENGFFAFVHLPEGFHSVVASHGSAYMSHANVVVDDETVSVAKLESTLQSEKVGVRVFDALSGQPKNAQLEMQSLPVALDVRGFAEINLSPIQRLSLMKVHPQDERYLEALEVYEDDQDSLYVPLIRGDWIQGLVAARKINIHPDSGTVVGFVSSSDFEVFLGHDNDFPVDQIVYFDASGAQVPKGVAGGGFVMFNVPVGVQSLVIMNSKTDLLQTQIAPIDESGLAVLKFH